MPKIEVKPYFDPVFDWLAKEPSLTSTEKLIVAHILRYGKRGCYESKDVFSKCLGINERTLDRAIKKLYVEQWITTDFNTTPNTYWVCNERLKGKIVFASMAGCGKPVSYGVKSLRIRMNQGGRFVRIWRRFVGTEGALCRLLNRKTKDLYHRDNRIKESKEKISQLISDERDKKKRMTKAQFEAKRREYHEQLKENL
jgi:hypothetical protein